MSAKLLFPRIPSPPHGVPLARYSLVHPAPPLLVYLTVSVKYLPWEFVFIVLKKQFCLIVILSKNKTTEQIGVSYSVRAVTMNETILPFTLRWISMRYAVTKTWRSCLHWKADPIPLNHWTAEQKRSWFFPLHVQFQYISSSQIAKDVEKRGKKEGGISGGTIAPSTLPHKKMKIRVPNKRFPGIWNQIPRSSLSEQKIVRKNTEICRNKGYG